jgi:anti-sigma regulatory factor (Ser/Thr protein kinase)
VTRAGTYTRYAADQRSPGQARREVRAFCSDHAMGGLVDDATLIASELVTNACRAADRTVTMALVEDAGTLLVIVGDDCPDTLPPVTADLDGPLAESGRGLFVLDQLAGAWGTSATAVGKNVWFRLPRA